MAFKVSDITDVGGFSLERLNSPIEHALNVYARSTDEVISFDTDMAAGLRYTPDRGYSARACTPVMHAEGDIIGNLHIYAMKHGDGNGDTSTFSLNDLNTGDYPHSPRVLPKSGNGINSELYFPIATHFDNRVGPEPSVFAGNLDLLGKVGSNVTKIAELGQDSEKFESIARQRAEASPVIMQTMHGGLDGDPHFGDSRALYNNRPGTVQTFGILALSDEVITEHPTILRDLSVVDPAA